MGNNAENKIDTVPALRWLTVSFQCAASLSASWFGDKIEDLIGPVSQATGTDQMT